MCTRRIQLSRLELGKSRATVSSYLQLNRVLRKGHLQEHQTKDVNGCVARTIWVEAPAAYHQGPLSPNTRHTVEAWRSVDAQVAVISSSLTPTDASFLVRTCGNDPRRD